MDLTLLEKLLAYRLGHHEQERPARVLAIAMGSRTTKAVTLQRAEKGFELLGFTIHDTPPREGLDQAAYGAALTELFKKIKSSMGDEIHETVLVLGYGDTFLRHADMPSAPVPDLRGMLEIGSKSFFPENLQGYDFDCCVAHANGDSAPKARQKVKVLVGGVKRDTLIELRSAAERAGLTVRDITVSQVGQARAITSLLGMGEGEAVATLDVGFSHSSICILSEGDIVHSRVVTLGGDKLTRGLAEAMNVSYAAAEGVKLVLPDKVGATLKDLLSSLASELKGSIDFFEVEYGRKVGCIYVSGGSARSALIIQTLQDFIPVPFKQWETTGSLILAVPEAQVREVQREAPQLTVAIGAGLDCLAPGALRINFLSKEQEAEDERRRDPMRPSIRIACFLFGLMLVWSISLICELLLVKNELKGVKSQMARYEKSAEEVATDSREIGEIDHRIAGLVEHTTNRFLWAIQLNELQKVIVDDIVVTHLTLEQSLSNSIPVLNPPKDRPPNPADRGRTIETITLTIQAKDFDSPGGTERFIEKLNSHAYFEKRFRNSSPITLKNRVARQIDGTDPSRSFALITLECVFRERVLGYE